MNNKTKSNSYYQLREQKCNRSPVYRDFHKLFKKANHT